MFIFDDNKMVHYKVNRVISLQDIMVPNGTSGGRANDDLRTKGQLLAVDVSCENAYVICWPNDM